MRVLMLLLLVAGMIGCDQKPTPLTPLEEYSLALETWNMERRLLSEIESNESTDPQEIADQKLRVKRARGILQNAEKRLK